MPALPSVNKVIRVALSGILGDSAWANVLHWAYAGGALDFGDAATVASDIASYWHARMHPDLSSDQLLQSVKVEDLTSSTSAVGEWLGSYAGAGAASDVPASTAFVLSHKINRRYRGGHPRTYVNGVVSADFFNVNQYKAANIALWLADWNLFRGDVAALALSTGSPFTFVNVSYRSGGVVRAVPVVDTVIDTAVQDRICSQRRRLGPLLAE